MESPLQACEVVICEGVPETWSAGSVRETVADAVADLVFRAADSTVRAVVPQAQVPVVFLVVGTETIQGQVGSERDPLSSVSVRVPKGASQILGHVRALLP